MNQELREKMARTIRAVFNLVRDKIGVEEARKLACEELGLVNEEPQHATEDGGAPTPAPVPLVSGGVAAQLNAPAATIPVRIAVLYSADGRYCAYGDSSRPADNLLSHARALAGPVPTTHTAWVTAHVPLELLTVMGKVTP